MKILLFNKLEFEMKLYMKNECVQNKMAALGFEPTPPKRLVPKTSALDRSATLVLTYYLPAFTVTRKKEKKPARNKDKNISNHRRY